MSEQRGKHMDNNMNYSQADLQKLLEKAQRELQEKLDKMTPEERAAAEAKAKKLIEDDEADRKALLESAAAVAAGHIPKEKVIPKFCPNCGAKTEGGKFCSYCGNPL